MPTTISKLFPTGILQVRGELDELTYGSIKIGSTGTYASLFDEVTYNSTTPDIKNLLTYTEDFSQWANVGHIITTNQAIAPDGRLTADRIQATTGSVGDYTAILNNSSVGGASYTFSFWVKSVSSASGTWGVNYFNGAHNRSTVPITGEWTRQSITFSGTGGLFNVYVADNRSSLATITDAYVWGAQLERGTTPTIYQGIAAPNTLVASGLVKRETNNGNLYVTGFFDEYTISPGFIQADGGTISTYTSSSTNYKTHTFISSVSTFTVTTPGTVDIVLVGGGGGGSLGYNSGPFHSPGNGGDGGTGLSTSTYLEPGLYTISVGNGGSFGFNASNFDGQPGGTTTALGFTAFGGGGGSSTRLNQAGTTNGILSSISGLSIQYGQGGPITPGTVVGASGTNGTGNGGASGGDGNFSGGQGGTGVVIIRYVTQ